MTPTKETRTQAFNRVINRIRRYFEIDTVETYQAIREAKEKELWKEKYTSWTECCEAEFGKSRRRVEQMYEVGKTMSEILSVQTGNMFPASDPKNKGISTEIVSHLNTRQVAELKGLEPTKKVEVLSAAIKASGGKSPKPEIIATARKAIGPCAEFSNGKVDLDSYTTPRDEVDPADKISRATERDVASARAVLADSNYPKSVQFDVLNCQEEESFFKWSEKILSKRGEKRGHRSNIDLPAAIRSVCNAYKKTVGKTLPVKPLDAGQLRRLLESGITLEEFISVGEKAWKSKGFLAQHSHQIAMFVKHYGNIRNEIENYGTNKSTGKIGVDRNAGTTNAGTIGIYDGVGKVICK